MAFNNYRLLSATKKRWISAAKTLFHDVVKLDAKAILLHKVARGGRRLPEPGERRGKLPIGQGAAAFRAAAGTMIRHKRGLGLRIKILHYGVLYAKSYRAVIRWTSSTSDDRLSIGGHAKYRGKPIEAASPCSWFWRWARSDLTAPPWNFLGKFAAGVGFAWSRYLPQTVPSSPGFEWAAGRAGTLNPPG
ncbi:hypothetical protein VTH82DRAFT_2096 [Thermothelomyces myriococcoides]